MANEWVPTPKPAVSEIKLPEPEDLGRNLPTVGLPNLFAPEHDRQIQALHAAALRKAHAAVRWYATNIGTKRVGALFLRFGSILLGAIAALVPLAVQLVPEVPGKTLNLLPFASVAAALAATCVLLDKFFGFSSGWMRYTSARLDLQRLIERFELDWTRSVLTQTQPPTSVGATLDLIQAFITNVSDVVRAETQAWVTEFKSALSEAEKAVADSKAALPSQAPRCALKVSVAKREELDEPKELAIRVNDLAEITTRSPTYVLSNLPPRQYAVKVHAQRKGKPVTGEDVVTLKPGDIASMTITLD